MLSGGGAGVNPGLGWGCHSVPSLGRGQLLSGRLWEVTELGSQRQRAKKGDAMV